MSDHDTTTDAGAADTGSDAAEDVAYETKTAPLIDHALQAMLNEHGAQGWELVEVEGDAASMVAHLRRPVSDPVPWEYATVPLIPVAREQILTQWTEMGYELALEVGTVGYFKRPRGAST